MPDFHFHTLNCAPDRIAITCSECGRRGSYARERAIADHGDITLPDYLRAVSADCPRRGFTVNGPGCMARFDEATIEALRCGQ